MARNLGVAMVYSICYPAGMKQQTGHQVERFTWESLVLRLLLVPLLAVAVVFILIHFGDNSMLLQCLHTSPDGLCVVSVSK